MRESDEAEEVYLKRMREVKARLPFSEIQLRAYNESSMYTIWKMQFFIFANR
jgi:hypothetical protein